MTFTYNKSCENCLYKSICKFEDTFSKVTKSLNQ